MSSSSSSSSFGMSLPTTDRKSNGLREDSGNDQESSSVSSSRHKRMKKSFSNCESTLEDANSPTNTSTSEGEVVGHRPSGKVKFFRARDDTLSLEREDSISNMDCKPASMKSIAIKSLTPPDDLTSTFSTDVLCRITSFLNPKELLRLGTTNREFHSFTQTNSSGWDYLCERLWSDKIYVSNNALQNSSKMQAYQESLTDSKRQYITMDELCYETSKIIWSFRFKSSAGTDWTSVDPWHAGRPCRKVVFLRDGRVQWVVPPDNPDHPTDPAALQVDETVRFTDPPLRMTWRFLTRPMDLPSRRLGSYVRFNVGGRDVPTYAVSRSPTGNWGFVMESCWGLYGSFELPPKQVQQPSNNHHRHQILLARRRPGEADGVVWIHEHNAHNNINNRDDDDVDTDDSDDVENNSNNAGNVILRNMNRLLQDETLTLTNEVQWREAFLYNVGARVLPEGDQAADEFDRAWQGL